jgi:methionine-rich copper-binding protein CopC
MKPRTQAVGVAVLQDGPTEIWLHFNVLPDLEKTSFSVAGPHGEVELGDITADEDPTVVRASVAGEMPAGNYWLAWVGAPMDDEAVRGRFSFSIQEIR